jgi:hypothetical protein
MLALARTANNTVFPVGTFAELQTSNVDSRRGILQTEGHMYAYLAVTLQKSPDFVARSIPVLMVGWLDEGFRFLYAGLNIAKGSL